MARGLERTIPVINEIITGDNVLYLPPFATTNQDKLSEIAAALGIPVGKLEALAIHVDEIQSEKPEEVAAAKAKAAYEVFGRPVIIEDTSLFIHSLAHKYPAPHVKFWTSTTQAKQEICEEAHRRNDPRALAKTTLAIYDGKRVHMRTGTTAGTIANVPQGSSVFGWDDIFIPDGQEILEKWDGTERTFAQMSLEEKQLLSMRQRALEKLKEDPFALGTYVFALAESEQMEVDAIELEFFKGEAMRKARQHAFFGLRVLTGIEENEDLEVDITKLPPYREERLHEDIIRYAIDPKSPDLGLIVTTYELRKALDGSPTRLIVNDDGRPTFLQHSARSLKRALAARAFEFALHHNKETYQKVRRMLDGKKTESRPSKPSPVIDAMLRDLRLLGNQELSIPHEGTIGDDTKDEPAISFAKTVRIHGEPVTTVPGFSELAYARQYSKDPRSRSKAAMEHIINVNGIPTSIFALGGMPPVTGSRDVVTTAALSFMRSYIPHNSLFANFDRRLALFKESRQYVENLIDAEENKDIQDLCVRQIGVCMSGNDMETITSQAGQLIDAGCRSIRIYTTNPGPEVPDAVRTICEIVQNRQLHEKEKLPFHICVGPIVNYEQGNTIREIAEQNGVALTFLVGHGGGENCTSLAAGAAANAIQIMQDFITDERFNNVSLGFEGGLGEYFGPWLGLIDVISKDGSMVHGTVESQNGLTVLHKDGAPVQMYAGTASPTTQMIEKILFNIERTNPAGFIKNNEGKPNFMAASRWSPTMIGLMWNFRSLFGRALADQRSDSIDELRRRIKQGYNHLQAGTAAQRTARAHRGE
ncbi:hypothetical protein KC726_00815 [Candidatus Woesebacteria bacterium]|nr:hypothetical protein [Candidatus Woesebacteria bacterium]